jgi:4'-phosphopantetheinyl transferase
MAVTLDKSGLVGPSEFTQCRIPLHQLAQPRAGEVQLWYLDLNLLGRSLQHALGDSGERGLTLGQLRFARRFYLKLLLGALLGIPGKSVRISRGTRGKPVLDKSAHDSDLHFSMAKSGDRLLIGVSTSGLVGVDLEPADRRAHDPLGVAQRYFNAPEARALEDLAPERLDQAFLRAWACKEAVVKASGEGIANQLCRFSVEIDPDRLPSVLEFENGDAAQWSLALVQPENEFIGAVAVHHALMTVRAFKLMPVAQ